MNLLSSAFFAISAFLIMFGLAHQTMAILNKGFAKNSSRKAIGLVVKFCGFILLAFAIFHFKNEDIISNLFVFLAVSVVTISFFLLATRR